jgi:hypothetical protein
MPTKSVDFTPGKPVPLEYAGKWVAWSSDHSQVVAHCDSIEELWRLVRERKISDPIYEKVPHSDVRFVGMR